MIDDLLNLTGKMSSDAEALAEGANASQVTLYHDPRSHSCQKVLVYLHERGIQFKPILVSLRENQHLAKWYLAINPRGEVPTLTISG